jgi:hypothetical protein
MSTTNTTYNPLLRATRAAFRELTTPEAWRWYGQQLQTSAALAHRITQPGLTLVRRWISARSGQVAVAEPVQTDTLAQSAAPEQTDAVVEPVQAITSTEASSEAAELVQDIAPTSLAPMEEVAGAAGVDYELLEDSNDILAADDETLAEDETSEEETDTSFYEPEDEDATDDLTHEPEDAAQPQHPSMLSQLVQEYMRQKNITSTEAVGEDGPVRSAHASNSTAGAGAAAFVWEDTPADGSGKAEAGE